MKVPFFALFVAASACGDAGTQPGVMTGRWSGAASAGWAVTLLVERETSATASLASVEGILTIGDARCLRTAPIGGTRTEDVLELSAWGAGSVSTSTFVDIRGLLSGDTINGTIELSGDGTLDACDLDRQALTLSR